MEVDSNPPKTFHRVLSSSEGGSSSMEPQEYKEFWEMLKGAVNQMLFESPGSYKPISYEQMYSAVYKCVCKQYSDQLYADLICHMRTRLSHWTGDLNQVPDQEFILKFHTYLDRYFNALGGIVPIFTYMNRYAIAELWRNLTILIRSGFISRPSSTPTSTQS